MKKCCYDPANLRVYGTRKKEVKPFNGSMTVRYTTYLRCKRCKTLLLGDVVKTIHDRKLAAA